MSNDEARRKSDSRSGRGDGETELTSIVADRDLTNSYERVRHSGFVIPSCLGISSFVVYPARREMVCLRSP